MKRALTVLSVLAAVAAVPALAVDPPSAGLGNGEGNDSVGQQFCQAPDQSKWEQLPDFINAYASHQCFDGVTHWELADNFLGDGSHITGIGFWSVWLPQVPANLAYRVRIYPKGDSDCPSGPALFDQTFNVVQVGAPEGPLGDFEAFLDFADNGVDPFFKEDGVNYSMSIVGVGNCGAYDGNNHYWTTSAGLDGKDLCYNQDGGPWTSFAGIQVAFYLCNEPVGTPVEDVTWSSIKANYR